MFKAFFLFSYKVLKRIKRELFYIFELFYYKFIYRKPNIRDNYGVKRFIIGGTEDLSELSKSYKKFFSLNINEKIKQADLICEHIFNLLGNDPVKLSFDGIDYKQINWHCDFKSGYKWNFATFFRYVKYGHKENVDIKVPWELSYFHHLTLLGQAYLLTLNDKYYKEFENEIMDWIDNNRVGFGVGWACSMIVAIRVVNWLIALEHFSQKAVLAKEFLNKFYISIYEHGKFIWGHLEYSPNLTTNHYLFNLAGLFFIAVYCPFFKESKEWKKFAIRELTKEIDKQIYDDGCDFEASTLYHRLVLEMFFYFNLLAYRAGIALPKKFKDNLKKMLDVSLYCIKPNGMIPQIGDNDSGRFLIFGKRPILENKYLLSLASIYYNNSFFKSPNFNFDEEAFWVFGKRGKKVYDELPLRIKPLGSKTFPDAGWYIMRHNRDYCFVSCGPNGQNGRGGHGHNDKLSFELILNGQDIIVDPGTYVYTSHPKERNKFRSTEYHNTIKFNDYEQNDIPENDLFSLHDNVEIKKALLIEDKEKIVFQGEIQHAGITHKRIITFDNESSCWHVQDNFFSSKSLNGRLVFHLSPDLTSKDNDILIKETEDKIASIEVTGSNVEKDEYDYSPEYGVKVKADCLVINISATKDAKTINTYIHRR